MQLKRTLNLFDIVLFNLVAILGLRWIASAAASGPSSIILWTLAMLLLFIPQGLAVAELSSKYPEEAGLYVWSKRAFGGFHGFTNGWCYWVNNLFYFPGLLMFVSANVAFMFHFYNPDLQLDQSKWFVTTLTLAILWVIAGLNIIGLRVGKWLQNIGGLTTWIPAFLLITMGAIAWFTLGSANTFTFESMIPNLSDRHSISFFSEMCFAFAGLELMTMLSGEIHNPVRTITRSIIISGVVIAAIYLLGTVAILIALPMENITTMNGILLPVQEIGGQFGMSWLAIISALCIVIAGCGGTMAWFTGISRLPYVVGIDRYLPAAFGKLHPKFGTPYVAIIAQTLFATLFMLIVSAGSGTKVETVYNILVDLGIILFFIPYLYLFASLIKLGSHEPDQDPSATGVTRFRIPGGSLGRWVIGGVGFVATALAILMAMLPSSSETAMLDLAKVIGGTVFMLGLGFVLYLRGKK